MSLILPRRKFLIGLGVVLGAPAIVKAERLMRLPRRRKPLVVTFPAATEGNVTLNGVVIFRSDGSPITAGELVAGRTYAILFRDEHAVLSI